MSTSAKVLLGLAIVVLVGFLARPSEVALPPELVEQDATPTPEPPRPSVDPADLPPLRRSLLVHAFGTGTLVSRSDPMRLPAALRASAVNGDGRVLAVVVGPQEAIGPDLVVYRTGDLTELLRLPRETSYRGHLMLAPEGDAVLWVGARGREPLLVRHTLDEDPTRAEVPLPDGARFLDAEPLPGGRVGLHVEAPNPDAPGSQERLLIVDLGLGAAVLDVALPPTVVGGTARHWAGAEAGDRYLLVHPDGDALTTVDLEDGSIRTAPIAAEAHAAAAAPREGLLTPDGASLYLAGPGPDGEPLPLVRLPLDDLSAPQLGQATAAVLAGIGPDGASLLLSGADDAAEIDLRVLDATTLLPVAITGDSRQVVEVGYTVGGDVGVVRRRGAEWTFSVLDGGTLALRGERRFGVIHRSFPGPGIVIEGVGG